MPILGRMWLAGPRLDTPGTLSAYVGISYFQKPVQSPMWWCHSREGPRA